MGSLTGSWICHFEGVNFAATLADTNDLSTMRGASLALLKLDVLAKEALDAAGFKPDQVFSGASQCAFRFEAAGGEEALVKAFDKELKRIAAEAAQPVPLRHLSFVHGIAPLAGEGREAEERALKTARARALARQHRQWTVTPPALTGATDADPFDRVSPAVEKIKLPKGKSRTLPLNGEDEQRPHDEVRVSTSVAARRKYGRTQRQQFYADELGADATSYILGKGDDRLVFTDSIEDIVDDPPSALKVSLNRKVALVYADGNSFGAAREKLGTPAFSAEVKKLQKAMLAGMLEWLAAGARHKDEEIRQAFRVVDAHKHGPGLRFETLLWGGDETMFVMPSWLATAFVELFFDLTGEWKIGGQKLTHALGIVIANAKTPVRQLQKIAKEAADAAKDLGLRGENSATFEIFESLAPPDVSIVPMRKHLYGIDNDDDLNYLTQQLALPGDKFGEAMRLIERLSGDGGFPRSQIYAALRKARQASQSLMDRDSEQAVLREFDLYARRAGRKLKLSGSNSGFDKSQLALPLTSINKRETMVNLLMLTQLWDYASPLGGALRRGATAGAAP